MKVLLSVAVWGNDYVRLLTDFSIASQLSSNNIPKLARLHQVTYHIITTRDAATSLRKNPTIELLGQHCALIWDHIEDYGYNPFYIPRGKGSDKYPFLSRLQNISIERSSDYDVLVFNYADFIWADGSLSNTIALMQDKTDAVLSFCLPVTKAPVQQVLNQYRDRADALVINVDPRVAASIAIGNLHPEAKLRFWEGPRFTDTPTYLLWAVADEGLIIRAYHQTVLALRVRRNDPEYRAGIRHGSLDGYFTSTLAEKSRVVFASNSDDVLVFSLYETNIDSGVKSHQTREMALETCLRTVVSEGQRRFAAVPIYVKQKYENAQAWKQVAEESQKILDSVHKKIPSNPEVFAHMHSQLDNISFHERHWRASGSIIRSLYVRAFLKIVASPLGAVFKSAIGRSRVRSIRLKIEGWLFRP